MWRGRGRVNQTGREGDDSVHVCRCEEGSLSRKEKRCKKKEKRKKNPPLGGGGGAGRAKERTNRFCPGKGKEFLPRDSGCGWREERPCFLVLFFDFFYARVSSRYAGCIYHGGGLSGMGFEIFEIFYFYF